MLEDFQQKRYETWRDEKLANYHSNPASLFVEVNNPLQLSSAEKKVITDNCRSNNLSFIKIKPNVEIRGPIHSINAQLGLVDFDQHLCVEDDGLVVIEDTNAPKKGGYVPYSNKALNWHTDGYYNPMDALVGAFSLYCIQPATKGGENRWIDPEMLYIHFRELNPDIVSALSQLTTLTIPTRREDNQIVREASIGPVFFIDKVSQKPKMRFTQRKRNISWLGSIEITDALCALNDFLTSDSEIHHQYKLAAGEGLVCNNVLHNRSSFIDSNQQRRKLLRGRYRNSVSCN
jgi:hypothetical protein